MYVNSRNVMCFIGSSAVTLGVGFLLMLALWPTAAQSEQPVADAGIRSAGTFSVETPSR